MEATLVQERRSIALATSSQVFPDPNRNMMGRLTHHVRSSIRCAFVTFATALAAATRGSVAWVFGGGDKSSVILERAQRVRGSSVQRCGPWIPAGWRRPG
jgi:hypothetical protein